MDETQQLCDAIDQLVDDQLARYDSRSGYDHNVGQEQCGHCGWKWHGLPMGRCPGSTFIGPIPMPWPPGNKFLGPTAWLDAVEASGNHMTPIDPNDMSEWAVRCIPAPWDEQNDGRRRR